MNDLVNLGFVQEKESQENLLQVSEGRAVAEVQAAFVIAKRFPRNESESYARIINACKRPFLAEKSLYAYPRGGTLVQGPSIRLAEAMAQAWGNLDCGVREVSQQDGVSIAEAYAIDLQTNTRVAKTFHVPHFRDTKKGRIKLTDSRDVYEAIANQGARRLRACILAVIPGDITEAAVEQCKRTMTTHDVTLSEQIKKLVIAFDEVGVKVEHLEKRLGHNLDATIAQEIVTLRSIYRSIKDGMSDRSDFFDIASKSVEDAREQVLEALKQKDNK